MTDLLKPLLGGPIPGGCDHCAASTTVTRTPHRPPGHHHRARHHLPEEDRMSAFDLILGGCATFALVYAVDAAAAALRRHRRARRTP